MTRYNCKYEYFRRFGQTEHVWTIVGSIGAIHLHITDRGEDKGPANYRDRYYGGLEVHYRQSPDGRAPDHEMCPILHGPCWHDGSSLAVSEIWIPRWIARPTDHDAMFAALEVEADQCFDRRSECPS